MATSSASDRTVVIEECDVITRVLRTKAADISPSPVFAENSLVMLAKSRSSDPTAGEVLCAPNKCLVSLVTAKDPETFACNTFDRPQGPKHDTKWAAPWP
jgi:hypothetical protein